MPQWDTQWSPDYIGHTAIMIHKLRSKSSSVPHWGISPSSLKITAYNLKDSCLILHWKIQHEYLKKNFSYSGVKAWNSLQTTIKAEPSL